MKMGQKGYEEEYRRRSSSKGKNSRHQQRQRHNYSDDDDRYDDYEEEYSSEHRKHYKRERERRDDRDDYNCDREYYDRRCKCDHNHSGERKQPRHNNKTGRRVVKRERPDSSPPPSDSHYTPMPKTISSTDDDAMADRKPLMSAKKTSNHSGGLIKSGGFSAGVKAMTTVVAVAPTPRKSLLPTPQSLEEHIEKLLVGCRMERDVQKLSAVIGEILGMYKILGNPSEAIKSQFNRKIQLSDRRFAGYDTTFADSFEHVWSYALIEHCRTSSKTNKSFLMRFIDFSRVDGLVADSEERCSVAFRLLAAFSGLQLNDLIVEVADADELRDVALKAEGGNMRIVRLSGRYHIAICRQSLPISGSSFAEAMAVYVILYFYFNLRFPDEWREFLHILTVLMGLPLPPRKQLNDNIVDIINGAYEVIEQKRRQLVVFKWTPKLLHNSAPAVPIVTSVRSSSGDQPPSADAVFSKSAPPTVEIVEKLMPASRPVAEVNTPVGASKADQSILKKFHDFAVSGVSVLTAAAVGMNAPKPANNGLNFSGILPAASSVATPQNLTDSEGPVAKRAPLDLGATRLSFGIEKAIDVLPLESGGSAMAGFPAATPTGTSCGDSDQTIKKIKRECCDEEEAFIIV